ncbi:hypothetical protein [Rothia terrae]|uniref:Uncharacterized protein n=1 Tax=Rothia terrae TaxID=396015 RepID=A0A7S6WWG8_9MICC|nr:hypothetical protein [Rothia terrae]QOW64759.1 hypothetical protein IDM49_11760 [Rothia terrae]
MPQTLSNNPLIEHADFSVARYAVGGVMQSDLSAAEWMKTLEPFEFAHEARDVVESIDERFDGSVVGLWVGRG